MWQEGSSYYPTPVSVTLKELKKGSFKHQTPAPTMFDVPKSTITVSEPE